ncbi:SUZ RNA-binding domain-containing-like [Antedon mediterranea]|uniref:SUZ RNA-binding domain-containing-like n=1 Tax=Antedon mediterranea TaxID=105859 RepID=UPI003AF5E723
MEKTDSSQSDELGDWEDMLDSGELDKRLKVEDKIFNKRTQQEKIREKVVLQEDSQRTAYHPQLRILKRDNPNSDRVVQDDVKTKILPKTFAQREAEYLEARQRIMGDQKEEAVTDSALPVASISVTEKNIIRQPKGPQEESKLTCIDATVRLMHNMQITKVVNMRQSSGRWTCPSRGRCPSSGRLVTRWLMAFIY